MSRERDVVSDSKGAEAVRAALNRVVDGGRKFPDNVFIGEWDYFFFFDSDWMFDTNFVEQIKAVLLAERSACACISNLDATANGVPADEASFIIDQSTAGADYATVLKGSQSKPGWTYGFDRFACASETGTWCMYCERRNELAVMAVRGNLPDTARQRLVGAVKALPISKGIAKSHIYGLSTTALSEDWRAALIANYAK